MELPAIIIIYVVHLLINVDLCFTINLNSTMCEQR